MPSRPTAAWQKLSKQCRSRSVTHTKFKFSVEVRIKSIRKSMRRVMEMICKGSGLVSILWCTDVCLCVCVCLSVRGWVHVFVCIWMCMRVGGCVCVHAWVHFVSGCVCACLPGLVSTCVRVRGSMTACEYTVCMCAWISQTTISYALTHFTTFFSSFPEHTSIKLPQVWMQYRRHSCRVWNDIFRKRWPSFS